MTPSENFAIAICLIRSKPKIRNSIAGSYRLYCRCLCLIISPYSFVFVHRHAQFIGICQLQIQVLGVGFFLRLQSKAFF